MCCFTIFYPLQSLLSFKCIEKYVYLLGIVYPQLFTTRTFSIELSHKKSLPTPQARHTVVGTQ